MDQRAIIHDSQMARMGNDWQHLAFTCTHYTSPQRTTKKAHSHCTPELVQN